MPSHTPASALVKLYFALRESPWTFTLWQQITEVYHGLNPEKDSLLPEGLSRDEIASVLSYFDRYNNLGTEDEKIKFAAKAKKHGKDSVPGRGYWTSWVNARYNARWQINQRISNIFDSLGVHPEQIMAETGESTPPPSGSYLPLALDIIGRDVFGPEALDSNHRLIPKLREPALILAQRAWFHATKRVGPKNKKADKAREKAESLLAGTSFTFSPQRVVLLPVKGLDNGKITMKQLNQAIRAVASYEKAAEALYSSVHRGAAEVLKARLEGFIPDDVPKSSGAKRVSKPQAAKKVTRESLAQLATADEVAQLLAMYDQFFGPEADSGHDLEIEDSNFVLFGEPVEGASPGVEVEAKMTSSQLAENLGFTDNMPVMFNTKRHSSGHSAWSKEFEDASKADSPLLEPFGLQWHQLAGVHAALRKILSPSPDSSNCAGILFADDVGLGKTIQASSIMAFLSILSVLQERGLSLPPLARELPYLKDSSSIPNLPHLVVMPGTLLRQWEHELQCFYKSKSVDILIYGTTPEEHADFWRPDGIYHSSRLPPSHRIILASHSALQRDFTGLYTSNRGSRDLPWEHPERTPKYNELLPHTVFGHEYLTVTLDEAQGLRNVGQRHSAALRILEQAAARIILTATPLQTSTKDISAMARLTGIPFFFSYQAYVEQVSDNATLRKAKKERDAADDESLSVDDDPVKAAQVDISKRLQSLFQGRVIRREADSLDNEGNKLISLPPLHVSHCILYLTEREKEILEEITLQSLSDASDAAGRSITSTTFYIEHRMGVTFARADPSEPIPVFKSIEEWETQLSTKIDNLVTISIHFLTRDDMPMVSSENGLVIYPRAPTTVGFTRNTKILIYQEFPSNTALVRNIFALRNVKTLAISGRDSFDKRAKTVSLFNEDPDYRVLIFSKVGSTGLNLTRANIILFLDQPWSAQDEKQIIGRAWRQRQQRPVYAIHLLAADTADITLFSLAQGKKEMLDAFLTTDSSQALMHAMTGDVVLDEEEEEERPLLSNRRPRKKPADKEKTDGETSKGPSGKSTVKGAKQPKKGKRVKSAEVVDDSEADDAQAITVPSTAPGPSRLDPKSPVFKVPHLPGRRFDQQQSSKAPMGDDDAYISFSEEASVLESGSDRNETSFDSRPPSTSLGDRSWSSLVGYCSSDADDMSLDVPSAPEPTVQHVNPVPSADGDVEMGAGDDDNSVVEGMVLDSDNESRRLARKRVRALSPPPLPTTSDSALILSSPNPAVPKKARLLGASGNLDDAFGDDKGPANGDDVHQSPLMKPLFPTLLSSLGVDDDVFTSSSPAPSLTLPSSPTPYPLKSEPGSRKLKFLSAKPFEFKPAPVEEPSKAATFGGVNTTDLESRMRNIASIRRIGGPGTDWPQNLYTLEHTADLREERAHQPSRFSQNDEEKAFTKTMALFINQVTPKGLDAAFLGHCYSHVFNNWPLELEPDMARQQADRKATVPPAAVDSMPSDEEVDVAPDTAAVEREGPQTSPAFPSTAVVGTSVIGGRGYTVRLAGGATVGVFQGQGYSRRVPARSTSGIGGDVATVRGDPPLVSFPSTSGARTSVVDGEAPHAQTHDWRRPLSPNPIVERVMSVRFTTPPRELLVLRDDPEFDDPEFDDAITVPDSDEDE
ncbi:hypothetical protein MD484_g6375, partial [Candolleomyces efflorescens]